MRVFCFHPSNRRLHFLVGSGPFQTEDNSPNFKQKHRRGWEELDQIAMPLSTTSAVQKEDKPKDSLRKKRKGEGKGKGKEQGKNTT